MTKQQRDCIGLSSEELEFLSKKVKNHKLGLQLNYSEIDEGINNNYYIFKENRKLGINVKSGEKNNLLIEGDNYHALKALQISGTKVDVIYIDPPYNTGKDFIYNDDFNIKKQKVVGQDDNYRHSKWLSFMKKRLLLAKELLNDNGIIFVSIDDNEQAHLKVLMDDIFGFKNFISTTPRMTKTTAADSILIGNQHEYILFYAKNISFVEFKFFEHVVGGRTQKDKYLNERGQFYAKHTLDSQSIQYGSGSTDYSFEWNKKTWYPGGSMNDFKNRQNKNFKNGKWCWSWSKKLIEWAIKEEAIIEKSGRIYIKNYSKLAIDKNNGYEWIEKKHLRAFRSLEFTNSKFSNEIGTKELKRIFGEKIFPNPKPTILIQTILELSTNTNGVILDFFAGSGTTAQAVMQLNLKDGGNRKFILITNNEAKNIDTIKFPEEGIARKITRNRLLRIITGKDKSGNKVNWKNSKNTFFVDYGVRYLELEEVNKVDGEYEQIDSKRELYKNEFSKNISIEDFE